MNLEISGDSVVSILCPGDVITGGPEALHQLCDAMQRLGITGRIVYTPERPEGYQIPEPYRSYKIKIASSVSDRTGDFVIIPETQTSRISEFNSAQKIIWWLSIDNFLAQKSFKNPIKRFLNMPAPIGKKEISKFHNVAQSDYARAYLRQQGIFDVPMLSDYLSEGFFSSLEIAQARNRENIVVYNPKKGFEITQKIMDHSSPEVMWVPIQGMKPMEVIELLLRAKLYIDFGNHPGRDRIPREAAVAGCCILVGGIGSAANEQDMPIPTKYKIPPSRFADPKSIADDICLILDRFDLIKADFDQYRNWITMQKDTFLSEVASLFSVV